MITKWWQIFSPPVSKFIRIGIADKNDNPPYFDKNLYEAEVDENDNEYDICKYCLIIYNTFILQW